MESAQQVTGVKAHAVPQGLCENLINAIKLLANQKDGESPIESIFAGFCERSWKVGKPADWENHGRFILMLQPLARWEGEEGRQHANDQIERLREGKSTWQEG